MAVTFLGRAMAIPRWIPLLVGTLALAQEADPWLPAWELTARAEQLKGIVNDDGTHAPDLRREGLQLRLRWEADWLGLDWAAGLRSALGSDGNVNNLPRWDQQSSNGTRLDLAQADLYGAAEHAFGRVRLGFQALGLLTTPAMWDSDLRFLGIGATGGVRSGIVQEAGFRAAAGRVRVLQPGDDVDLAAVQGVLKLASGSFQAGFHADHWSLAWNPADGRLEAVDYGGTGRQRLSLDGLGASAHWEGPVPLEARWSGYRNPRTRDTSGEVQLLAGNRIRPFRPQAAFTWQRLSATGELYPLNSDQWYEYRSARGPRWDLTLPLRRLWTLSLAWMRQTSDWTPVHAERTLLTVTKRF